MNLFNLITSQNLTPNQLYLLYSIREKTKPKLINVHQEVRTLTPEWITSNTTLSTKAIKFLEVIDTYNNLDGNPEENSKPKKSKEEPHDILGEDYLSKIELYRSCFPVGKLPSGVPARAPIPELTKKFIKFFELFPNYGWDIIIKATERYVGEFAMKNYLYMKNASYFISKQDVDKNNVYLLASYCDIIINDTPVENEYYSVTVK